jgi:polar amino acid transport system permease protein
MTGFNLSQILHYQDLFLSGVLMTALLSCIAMFFGSIIGVLGAVGVRWGPRPVQYVLRAYVEVIRNTPGLIQLFIVFFVLPSFELRLPPFHAAAIAFSIYFGAYAIEIIRAGLDSIPRSQIEAGQCLGITRWEVFRHVICMPALRNIYPAFTSQIVLLVLGTSIASQISAEELFYMGSFVESRTYRSFEVYTFVCAIYLVMVLILKTVFAAGGRILFRWPAHD